MSDEEKAFHLKMDESHQTGDWLAFLVFADWLGEHDDPREFGYREMARLKLACGLCGGGPHPNWVWFDASADHRNGEVVGFYLPTEVFQRLEGGTCLVGGPTSSKGSPAQAIRWRDYVGEDAQHEARDAAARAFLVPAKTPEKVRKVRKPRARRT